MERFIVLWIGNLNVENLFIKCNGISASKFVCVCVKTEKPILKFT